MNHPKKHIKEAKTSLRELLNDQEILEVEEPEDKQLELELNQVHHEHLDHYHGVHHFDRFGQHDDVCDDDFSIKKQFSVSKRSEIFHISIAGLILGLAVAVSAIDALLEKFQLNIGGVTIDMRLLDLLVIILGLPLLGLWWSLGIAIVEPWFHFLIDGDHSPIQIAFNSVGYALTVCVFFFIFYVLFHNSWFHEEPSKEKRLFKAWMPMLVIVPILAIIFTAIFVVSLFLTYKSGSSTSWSDFTENSFVLIMISLGVEVLRFIVMYILFFFFQKKMKPINHRYR